MGLQCGIVGLPNIGKSTLFNALTETSAAEAQNYPFCTIEPNVGRVSVPDERLDKLAAIAGSKEIIPNFLEFVDIAGLVKGASQGEGLGNKFLSHIREVDAIIHILRCFDDDNITHVEGSIDPIRDKEIIDTELVIADLESLEKRVPNLEKKVRGNEKGAKERLEMVQILITLLGEGKPARAFTPKDSDEAKMLKELQLITSKKTLYVANVMEDDLNSGNEFTKKIAAIAEAENSSMIIICAKIEEEISKISDKQEKQEFLEMMGISEPGLSKIIKSSYKLLDLISFFTIGPKEAHAWTVKHNSTAPQAAGVIHTDFEKGFIRAETISYANYIQYNGEQGAKDNGKLRLEGKEYIVEDGDIFHFRFNV